MDFRRDCRVVTKTWKSIIPARESDLWDHEKFSSESYDKLKDWFDKYGTNIYSEIEGCSIYTYLLTNVHCFRFINRRITNMIFDQKNMQNMCYDSQKHSLVPTNNYYKCLIELISFIRDKSFRFKARHPHPGICSEYIYAYFRIVNHPSFEYLLDVHYPIRLKMCFLESNGAMDLYSYLKTYIECGFEKIEYLIAFIILQNRLLQKKNLSDLVFEKIKKIKY